MEAGEIPDEATNFMVHNNLKVCPKCQANLVSNSNESAYCLNDDCDFVVHCWNFYVNQSLFWIRTKYVSKKMIIPSYIYGC